MWLFFSSNSPAFVLMKDVAAFIYVAVILSKSAGCCISSSFSKRGQGTNESMGEKPNMSYMSR